MSDVLEAPYTRLLVDRFAETFRFYRNVLPELTGAKLAGGNEASGYASWDLDGRTVFALFGRGHMAAALGTAQLPQEQGHRTTSPSSYTSPTMRPWTARSPAARKPEPNSWRPRRTGRSGGRPCGRPISATRTGT